MSIVKKAISDFKRLLWVVAFFSLFSNLLMLAIPLYMLQIYDRVLPSQSTDTLIFLSIIAVFALLILGGMEAIKSVLANRASVRLDATLGDSVLRQVIKTGAFSGGNAQPMRDLTDIRNLISSKQVFAALDLPFATIFIGLLYFVHPHLFMLTLAGAAMLVLVAIFNQIATSSAIKSQAEKQISSSLQTESLARNADSIIAMGMVSNVVNYWGNSHVKSIIAGDKSAKANALFSGISRFIRLGIQIAILGYGAKLVLQGEMTAGMIFASSIVSGRALQPIDQVIGAWKNLSNGLGSWKRLKKFLALEAIFTEYTKLPTPNGLLQVNNVLQPNALDQTAKPVLANITFKIEPGTLVAVIGPSGSGKSTLARIIVGALKPRAGTVRLDGNEIHNWNPQDLGQYVGYLAQDVELLPGTIAQNISRFSHDPSSQSITDAANLAHVSDLIKSMPQGFDTLIGPGGAQLSGGERQRIGLARAFYGNPKLLVLDEPNSSLDRNGETALLKAMLVAKQKNISVMIISQRESALRMADKIMRMNSGRITDFGDKEQVIAKYSNTQVKKKIVEAPSIAPDVEDMTVPKNPLHKKAQEMKATVGMKATKKPAKTSTKASKKTVSKKVTKKTLPKTNTKAKAKKPTKKTTNTKRAA